MNNTNKNILKDFGVDEQTFYQALKLSPSARGYIIGAISEILLKNHLEAKGYKVVRIKEKPSGGNKAKNDQARGDFYIRKNGKKANRWLVVESKGLKSNSEFRGGKLDSPEKVFKFLKKRIFNMQTKEVIFNKGFNKYSKTKTSFKKKNTGKKFPDFKWDRNFPGPECYNLDGLWSNENELKEWVFSLDKNFFTEEAYRNAEGAIAILETHQPTRRKGIETDIIQAAPLVSDFNIMSIDLFLRTGKHEFVFTNSEKISHSPTSPEHLYQNYTIDILVKDKKDKPLTQPPWYDDIDICIQETNPTYRKIDRSQIDDR